MIKRNRFLLFILFFSILFTGCGKRKLLLDRYFSIAEKSLEKGEITKSIKNYKKVLNISPHSPKGQLALSNLADIYLQVGKYIESKKLYELYLETGDLKGKDLLDVIEKIGMIYERHLKNDSYALRYYKKGLEFTFNKEDRINFLVKIGRVYFNLYQFNDAVEYLEQAAIEYNKLSTKDFLSDLVQQALYYAGISYSIMSRDVKDRFQGGESYIDLDRDIMDKGLEVLNECINISEKTKYGILCKFQKADALIEIDEPEKALQTLEELISVYPHRSVVDNRIERVKSLIR